MSKVYLGLGSNLHAHKHLHNALTALARRFGSLEISPVYESRAVGFVGNNFLNLVVAIETDLEPQALVPFLKDIERNNGRDSNSPKFSDRTLDIDILVYDQWVGEAEGLSLPRAEILKHAFVLKPFADLAPDYIHPLSGRSLSEHWQDFPARDQPLWRTYFYWSGDLISRPESGLEHMREQNATRTGLSLDMMRMEDA